MDLDTIYTRWGIPMSDDKRWSFLKNRLGIIIDNDRLYLSERIVKVIAFKLGQKVDDIADYREQTPYGAYNEWGYYILPVRLIDRAHEQFELARLLEVLMNEISSFTSINAAIAELVNEANCGFRLATTQQGWLTFKAGDAQMDETVIRTLSFLAVSALIEYKAALDHYADGKWNEAADKTRRTLEEYLRNKLETKSGLSAAIKLLGSKLKDLEAPQHIRDHIVNRFLSLDALYNDLTKHKSNAGEAEAELTIYEVATLLNYVEKILQ